MRDATQHQQQVYHVWDAEWMNEWWRFNMEQTRKTDEDHNYYTCISNQRSTAFGTRGMFCWLCTQPHTNRTYIPTRDGREPKHSNNELNQKPGFAQNWTEPKSKNVQEPKPNPTL